jgi:pimeloyl-ACP methyl ester carboxylesterase
VILDRVTQLAPHRGALRFLSVPAGKVAVLDAAPTGQTRGTALLVPGYTGSKEDFAAVLEPLAGAGYRVVALDLPGQYQSPGPDERAVYTVPWLGSVVAEVADTLDAGPVHLLGHSFGGLVARAAVISGPARFRSLVLLCSGPAAIDGGRKERMARLEPYAGYGMAYLYEAMVAEDPDYVPVPGPLGEFLQERFVSSSMAGLLGMGDAILSEPDHVARLRDTAVPTLVCFGEADDAWLPGVQREMAGRLGAQLAVIEGAAHSPAAEAPGPTAAALAAFWASH